MLDIVSYVVFSSQERFPWNFGLKGFNLGISPILKLMAIPNP